MSTAAPQQNDAARLEQLWQESRRVHGVSLGQDAWRRLKRDRASFAALLFLALLGLLALLRLSLPLAAA